MPFSVRNLVTVQLTCADIPSILSQLQWAHIQLNEVIQIDPLTIRFQIKRCDESKLRSLLHRKGIEVKCINRSGIYLQIRSLFRRPVLLVGLIVIILLGIYLPTRIFFIRIDGNSTVPSRLIIEAAEQCGISFGASRRNVRSEKVKNALLQKIPQLQWIGVNTSGCVATISVKERQTQPQQPQQSGVSSIVASKDGIIFDMTVIQGSPVCRTGQAVSKGQVLISGYISCDQSIRATRAKGEIYATTGQKLSLAMPSDCLIRGEPESQERKYSIIFGKKRINLYQDSGILDSSCVKMYEEKYVTLPGGFQLPIALVTETYIVYQQSNITSTAEDLSQTLSLLAERYLKNQMVAGRIYARSEQFSSGDGTICLEGEYGCIEMIAKERNEEILKP